MMDGTWEGVITVRMVLSCVSNAIYMHRYAKGRGVHQFQRIRSFIRAGRLAHLCASTRGEPPGTGRKSTCRPSSGVLDGQRLEDVVDALRLEHDLRAVAARLFRELGAELVDIDVLLGR